MNEPTPVERSSAKNSLCDNRFNSADSDAP